MPRLSIGDFKPKKVVCEIRYPEAYLIFDRTGLAAQELRKSFPDITIVQASPESSQFNSTKHKASFVFELRQMRVTQEVPDLDLREFAGLCETFFRIINDIFELKTFLRVGLRFILAVDTNSLEDAAKLVRDLHLLDLPAGKTFDISEPPADFTIRWQNSEIGVLLRIAAESGKVNAVFSPAFFDNVDVKKEFNWALLDIDSYTVAPVQRDQWDSAEWIIQKSRIVRKEAGKILEK